MSIEHEMQIYYCVSVMHILYNIHTRYYDGVGVLENAVRRPHRCSMYLTVNITEPVTSFD